MYQVVIDRYAQKQLGKISPRSSYVFLSCKLIKKSGLLWLVSRMLREAQHNI